MIRAFLFFGLVIVLAAPVFAAEDQKPVVRVDVEPETVTVGKPVRLRVTVLVPTWFAKPPVYPSFELPNAVTRLPPDSSFPTSERVGRDNWAGIVRDYVIYPQIPAAYEMSGQTILVTYADADTREPVLVEMAAPPVVFTGIVPADARGLTPFVAGEALTLEQTVDGSVTGLKSGDAITRRVTATVTGVPALFLPPLLIDPGLDGLSVYPREPVVRDRRGQGDDPVVGVRTEIATYVFERGGAYTLAPVELRWWNTSAQRIETATVPAIEIAVTPGPGEGTPGQKREIGFEIPARLLVAAGLVLAMGVVGVRHGVVVLRWRRDRLAAWRASEAYAFRMLRRAVRSDEPRDIYNRAILWVDRLAPRLTLDALIGYATAVTAGQALRELGLAAYGRDLSAARFDHATRRRLLAALISARRAYLAEGRLVFRPTSLPALNPHRPYGVPGS